MNIYSSNSTKENDSERSKKIRRVIIDYCKDLKLRHPILKHQDILGFSILMTITITMVLSSLFYLYGYIPWWCCLILNTLCISLAHEI